MPKSSEHTNGGVPIVALAGAIALMVAGGRRPTSLGRVLRSALSNPVPASGSRGA